MRITNKMIQNNALTNVNINKEQQDKLNTQISSQQKITRPSDDPVIAIRALRLRSDLSNITQYYEKNIPDAENYLSVTEQALKSAIDVADSLYEQCGTAAKDYNSTSDRLKILETMKSLTDEFYSIGNSDYAGKTLFTGYRTGTKLTFQSDTTLSYTMTEKLTNASVEEKTYISDDTLTDVESVSSSKVTRIRLAYGTLDSDTDATVTIPGTPEETITAETISKAAATSPYELIQTDAYKDKIIMVPETGELLLGSGVAEKMEALGETQQMSVNYSKKEWSEGDLRPEHYFTCTANPGTTDEIKYNQDRDANSQTINIDVGYNQTLQINVLAGDSFQHAVGRDVEEMTLATKKVESMETTVKDLETELSNASDADKAGVQKKLDAANKALTLLKNESQTLFENGITKMQEHLDTLNLQRTNVGNTGTRVDLVKNRLQTEQSSFKELVSTNEGADVTELTVQLTSAKYSYEAALMATAKIAQTNLMNYL